MYEIAYSHRWFAAAPRSRGSKPPPCLISKNEKKASLCRSFLHWKISGEASSQLSLIFNVAGGFGLHASRRRLGENAASWMSSGLASRGFHTNRRPRGALAHRVHAYVKLAKPAVACHVRPDLTSGSNGCQAMGESHHHFPDAAECPDLKIGLLRCPTEVRDACR